MVAQLTIKDAPPPSMNCKARPTVRIDSPSKIEGEKLHSGGYDVADVRLVSGTTYLRAVCSVKFLNISMICQYLIEEVHNVISHTILLHLPL